MDALLDEGMHWKKGINACRIKSIRARSFFILGIDFMSDRRIFRQSIAILAAALLPLMLVLPAGALSMKECSVKFKAAQDAGQARAFRGASSARRSAPSPLIQQLPKIPPTLRRSKQSPRSRKKSLKKLERRPSLLPYQERRLSFVDRLQIFRRKACQSAHAHMS
jgi:hypothetical protein